ncbi:hypothetical protein [Paenibacillus agilis]|uniref:Uncharacterized protein n=1 Tax=Paenibacillus agilis TaxID=3020863 RepID=A0A559IWT5_9BACL|nr:hypothetical protein [Paenibacillus agilis]TVX92092.1 hypothetical protein FPZ44_02880 [Paenibacillus agilis]
MNISSSMHDLYGKYEIPDTIIKMLERQERSQDREDIGLFILQDDECRYMSTPIDSIPFATIGVDGIHYAFLTEFGAVENLNEAPIICVSPMDFGLEIRYAGYNLAQFLEVYCADEAILINHFEGEKDYMRYVQQREEEERREPDEGEFGLTAEELQERKNKMEHFREDFQVRKIERTFLWKELESIRAHRRSKIVIETVNGLGVLPNHKPNMRLGENAHSRLHWEVEEGNSALNELDEARKFVEAASLESRIGFVRDAQHYYMFDCTDWREWMIEQLVLWGYETEAKNLQLSFPGEQYMPVTDTLSTYLYLEWSSSDEDENK